MLQATVLESTADLLSCRPDIGLLLQEDGISDDLKRLSPPRRRGLWAMGHLLTYAGDAPCGLVALYAVSHAPRTLVLGPLTGRLVVGKRRTLAALAVMRHLAGYLQDWDELLIAGGGPESRRFETAARSTRLARRLIGVAGSTEPLLAISAAQSWRSRWRFRSVADRTLLDVWRVSAWLPPLEDDIAYSYQQAQLRAQAEPLMMQPPAVPEANALAVAPRGNAASPRAGLRVVSPDDE